MDRVDFDTKLLHADTTSFGIHGMYEDEDIGNTIESFDLANDNMDFLAPFGSKPS